MNAGEAMRKADRELGDPSFDDEAIEAGMGILISMKDSKDVSCESVQSLTDPGAEYSHHKGKGCQAQIT